MGMPKSPMMRRALGEGSKGGGEGQETTRDLLPPSSLRSELTQEVPQPVPLDPKGASQPR